MRFLGKFLNCNRVIRSIKKLQVALQCCLSALTQTAGIKGRPVKHMRSSVFEESSIEGAAVDLWRVADNREAISDQSVVKGEFQFIKCDSVVSAAEPRFEYHFLIQQIL